MKRGSRHSIFTSPTSTSPTVILTSREYKKDDNCIQSPRVTTLSIDAYYSEHNRYPAWAIGDAGANGGVSYNFHFAQRYGAEFVRESPSALLPTFVLSGNAPTSALHTLTTPAPYIAAYPRDPFAPVKGTTFLYWCIFPGEPPPPMTSGTAVRGVGWIVVSAGPDGDYDLAGEYDAYDPAIAQPSLRLLTGTNKRGSAYTYDPTNGSISDGDVWRIKGTIGSQLPDFG